MPTTQRNVRILALLSLVEGVLAFFWLLALPTNRQAYSLFRIAALAIILLILLISTALFIYLRTPKEKLIERIVNLKEKTLLSLFLIAASLLLWVAVLFKDQWLVYASESTYARLVPIVLYGLILCLQTSVFLLFLGRDKNISLESAKTIRKPMLMLLGIFLAAWLFISISRIGSTHDVVGLNWGPPGTPITFAQVNLAFVVSFLLVFGFLILRSRLHTIPVILFSRKDILIFLALWGLAAFLWWKQPMSPTYYTPAPTPPNNEYYPYSDASVFDTSSYHLLYGIGFANQLIRRPLYVGMLALFHKLAGANYEDTIFLQILLLALIPGLVFLLTSKLSNRLSGLLAGGLIILREKNSIELSDKIVTSHAKLMMSDMVTMLGVALFLYVTMKLLFWEKRENWQLAIIGASLGLTALIRAQVVILVLPLLLFIFLLKKPLKQRLKVSFFALLGLILVMAPWVWRNWNLTGTFVLDDRGEERLIARNYSSTPFALPTPQPGEMQEEFSVRIKKEIFTFVVTHPTDVLFFVSNHFFRNLVTSAIYVAPIYSADSPSSLVSHLPFWGEWDGSLPLLSGISIFVNLALLAAGVSIAGTKNKAAGYFPLVAFLFYSFGNALVRSSGWRFILPTDWIILVYYSIGLAYIPSKIKILLDEHALSSTVDDKAKDSPTPVFRAFALTVLLLLGASVPIAERLIRPQNYDSLTNNAKVDLSVEGVSSDEINTFLEQKDAVLISGVALYPRYARPSSKVYMANAPQEYKFLYFLLMDQNENQTVLPLSIPPKEFPNAAVVSVIGCRQDGYISAFAIVLHQPEKQVLLRDPRSPLTCPLTVQP